MKTFNEFLEDVNSTDLLYRGSPTLETKIQYRGFPGVFFSFDPEVALGYGKFVSKWKLKYNKLLNSKNPMARKLVNDFIYFYGKEYDQKQIESYKKTNNAFLTNPVSISDAKHDIDKFSIFLYPDENWIKLVKDNGYNGTQNDFDVCIFNINDVQYLGQYNPQEEKINNPENEPKYVSPFANFR